MGKKIIKRKTVDYLGAVKTLIEIYDRVKPDGIDGGYPCGSTTSIGYDVYEIVNKWIKENE
jgi:hypothetical protein